MFPFSFLFLPPRVAVRAMALLIAGFLLKRLYTKPPRAAATPAAFLPRSEASVVIIIQHFSRDGKQLDAVHAGLGIMGKFE